MAVRAQNASLDVPTLLGDVPPQQHGVVAQRGACLGHEQASAVNAQQAEPLRGGPQAADRLREVLAVALADPPVLRPHAPIVSVTTRVSASPPAVSVTPSPTRCSSEVYRRSASAAVVSSTSTVRRGPPRRRGPGQPSRPAVAPHAVAAARSPAAARAPPPTASAQPAPQPGRTVMLRRRPSPGYRRCPPAARTATTRALHHLDRLTDRFDDKAVIPLVAVVVGVEQVVARLRQHLVERTSQAGTPSFSPSSTSYGHRNRSPWSSHALSPREKRCRWPVGPAEHRLSTPCSSSSRSVDGSSRSRRTGGSAPTRSTARSPRTACANACGAVVRLRLRQCSSERAGACQVEELPGRGTESVAVHRGDRGSESGAQ